MATPSFKTASQWMQSLGDKYTTEGQILATILNAQQNSVNGVSVQDIFESVKALMGISGDIISITPGFFPIPNTATAGEIYIGRVFLRSYDTPPWTYYLNLPSGYPLFARAGNAAAEGDIPCATFASCTATQCAPALLGYKIIHS